MTRLHFQIDRDVTIRIGAGNANQSRPVSPETFFRWLQVTLNIRELSYPSWIIETPQGDLILDSQFHGMLFLHGILLPISTSRGKVFKFGYNFARGKFSCDRQRLAAGREVPNLVRQIWEIALHLHEETLLPIYVNLLLNFPRAADIQQADSLLEPSTKARIWKHLLHASRHKLFFYIETSSAQVSEIKCLPNAPHTDFGQSIGMIRDSTGKKPTRVPENLWNLLRSVSPIRTIEEEQQEFFKDARVCALPKSAFARTTDRALRACLAFLNATRDIRVLYVKGLTGKLDVFYDAGLGTLQIHHRWLDFDNVHQETSCRKLFLLVSPARYCVHS